MRQDEKYSPSSGKEFPFSGKHLQSPCRWCIITHNVDSGVRLSGDKETAMIKIAPSVLAADLANLGAEVEQMISFTLT